MNTNASPCTTPTALRGSVKTPSYHYGANYKNKKKRACQLHWASNYTRVSLAFIRCNENHCTLTNGGAVLVHRLCCLFVRHGRTFFSIYVSPAYSGGLCILVKRYRVLSTPASQRHCLEKGASGAPLGSQNTPSGKSANGNMKCVKLTSRIYRTLGNP